MKLLTATLAKPARQVQTKYGVRTVADCIDENGNEQIFGNMAKDKKAKILGTKLLIYECEGVESEITQWFKTINIVGVPLNNQELLNAVNFGPFVTLCKEEFSNKQNSNIRTPFLNVGVLTVAKFLSRTRHKWSRVDCV